MILSKSTSGSSHEWNLLIRGCVGSFLRKENTCNKMCWKKAWSRRELGNQIPKIRVSSLLRSRLLIGLTKGITSTLIENLTNIGLMKMTLKLFFLYLQQLEIPDITRLMKGFTSTHGCIRNNVHHVPENMSRWTGTSA